jgi:hypothetical protein
MNGLFGQNRILTIADVSQLHEKIHLAINSQLRQERAAQCPQADAIFFGMTPGEVDALFLRIDQMAMLDLLSTVEAHLRMDFQNRVREKRKDALSRQFRSVAKRRHHRIRLKEDILAGWSEHYQGSKVSINDFNAALKVRDWLAHGRYWVPKFQPGYNRIVVRDICNNLAQALFPPS